MALLYDAEVVRLIGEFEKKELYVGSVVITQFAGQNGAVQFREKLEKRGIKVYQHYKIEGYPSNIPLIVSGNGFGKNDYIETTRPLVVITAPGPGKAEVWQPVFHSFIMKTFAEPKPAMRSSRHSQSGIFR